MNATHTGGPHPCLAPGCRRTVPENLLCCDDHWLRIPERLRGELWDAFGGRGEGAGSDRHTRAVEAILTWLRSGR